MILNKFFKRVFSGLLSATVILSAMPNIPANAATGTTVYTYDGYEVRYSITNEWDSGQNVLVTVTNTGCDSIFNWSLKYNAEGNITNLYNAIIYDSSDTQYVIKNNNWNFEIAPNQSVNFGYELHEDSFAVPTEFELCSERTNISNGYDVVVNYADTWDTGVRGEITINNTSDEPLEAWTLSFDTNFTIDNIWNGRLLDTNNNHYTIASEMWTNPIPAGGSKTVGFVGTKDANHNAQFNNYSLSVVKAVYSFSAPIDGTITLSSSESDILAGTGYSTVYFYAMTDIATDNLLLIDMETDTIVATMVDDGNYNTSGDDMQGDGVFTCKLPIDISFEKDYYFYAQYQDSTMFSIDSNKVNIFVYNELTDEELAEMDAVDDSLYELISSSSFSNLSTTEKYNQTYELLLRLANQGTDEYPYGLIDASSIIYTEESGIFSFVYANGLYGAVKILPYNSMLMGTENSTPIGISSNNISISSSISNDLPSVDISALILYGIDDPTTTFSNIGLYENTQSTWEDLGIEVELDTDVTLDDFRDSLEGHTFIAMETHGDYYTYHHGFLYLSSTTVPAICTKEIVNKSTNKEYSNDIKKHRIEKVSTTEGKVYYILPDFFTNHYQNDELKDTFVFMGNCYGFGTGDEIDDSMAAAINEAGAECVVGFHESVFVAYGNEMVTTFFANISQGMTAIDALDNAKNNIGITDMDWAATGLDADTYAAFASKTPAYPVLHGHYYSSLWNTTLKNGSFDFRLPVSMFDPFISGWTQNGDTRSLQSLGDVKPLDGKFMSIITTGVGSAESDYLSGTEGSYISQQFRIPDDCTTLSFSYNFASEEPMEFVGSRYDDKFIAKIYDVHDNEVLVAASESINTSTWYSVDGINFAGGDSTAYQTGWKTVNIDVSQCTGAYITLKFSVFDVGDSAYDSAVLIDEVTLS